MLIRLQRIYNFWLFHAVILSFLDVLQSFYSHFLVLTYWHSAQCQLLFSACLLHHKKSIPNRVQMQWNFLWIFLGQKTSSGPRKHLWGGLRGAAPTRACEEAQARPGGLCPPRGTPQVLLWPVLGVLVHKNSPKSFAAFGLRLVLIFCDVKNKQKIATGTRHWVNRLVPKNDIKLL